MDADEFDELVRQDLRDAGRLAGLDDEARKAIAYVVRKYQWGGERGPEVQRLPPGDVVFPKPEPDDSAPSV